jgi:hypothetical protein
MEAFVTKTQTAKIKRADRDKLLHLRILVEMEGLSDEELLENEFRFDLWNRRPITFTPAEVRAARDEFNKAKENQAVQDQQWVLFPYRVEHSPSSPEDALKAHLAIVESSKQSGLR